MSNGFFKLERFIVHFFAGAVLGALVTGTYCLSKYPFSSKETLIVVVGLGGLIGGFFMALAGPGVKSPK